MASQLTKTQQEFQDVLARVQKSLLKRSSMTMVLHGVFCALLPLLISFFIKAKRIRSLEITGESLVGEGIRPEFIALINYSIVGLIQLEKALSTALT